MRIDWRFNPNGSAPARTCCWFQSPMRIMVWANEDDQNIRSRRRGFIKTTMMIMFWSN
jgi:hypothetical protein